MGRPTLDLHVYGRLAPSCDLSVQLVHSIGP